MKMPVISGIALVCAVALASPALAKDTERVDRTVLRFTRLYLDDQRTRAVVHHGLVKVRQQSMRMGLRGAS